MMLQSPACSLGRLTAPSSARPVTQWYGALRAQLFGHIEAQLPFLFLLFFFHLSPANDPTQNDGASPTDLWRTCSCSNFLSQCVFSPIFSLLHKTMHAHILHELNCAPPLQISYVKAPTLVLQNMILFGDRVFKEVRLNEVSRWPNPIGLVSL